MAVKKPSPPQPPGRPGGPVKEVAFPRFADETESRTLVTLARERAAMIERQAYQEGFAQGEAAGRRLGLAQAAPSVEALARLVERLDQLMFQTLARMEPEIVRMVLAIAERVIFTTIEADNTVIQRVVQAALKEVEGRWAVTVRVNPGDCELLQQHKDQWLRIDRADKVTLVPDPAIEPGGCIVETPQGFVDATLRTALARVAQLGEHVGE